MSGPGGVLLCFVSTREYFITFARAIEILRTDVVRTLRLLGCPSINKLDGSYIDVAR